MQSQSPSPDAHRLRDQKEAHWSCGLGQASSEVHGIVLEDTSKEWLEVPPAAPSNCNFSSDQAPTSQLAPACSSVIRHACLPTSLGLLNNFG